MPLRFVFALHNHQPVGNFGHVIEHAYRVSYRPFLELLEQYPEIPIALHTSGPLMEWFVEHKPEYIDRLRRMVRRGQVEIMGGGFYEPILPMIPPCDRVGQIASYKSYLENLFATNVRGMWVPERVWEQSLVSNIADAGAEYTVLDDLHFQQAGVEEGRMFGYHLSEDNGRLLRIFAAAEPLRYLVPYRDPNETLAYFGGLAARHPDAVVVFADDGEKFGVWPEMYRHCYEHGWLRRFFDALRGNRHWIQLCTFAQALDAMRPAGRVYLPDASYREMTEWALPLGRLNDYRGLVGELQHDPRWGRLQRFLRAGNWRNFKVRYPETQEMYARMLQVSRRIQDSTHVDAGKLAQARQELYRAQCNCPWWHGTFGGIYLPHLRSAVYEHLIAAEELLLEASPRQANWIDDETADLNLDGTPEVCLQNGRLAAYFHPAGGGSLYELDVRPIRLNVLATLARRPEAYHDAIRHHRGQVWKQGGLDHMLQYDEYLRKSLIDHFYEPGVTLEQLATRREREMGDFVTGNYQHRLDHGNGEVRLILWRDGQVAGQNVRVTKEIGLTGAGDGLEVWYVLENCPRQKPLYFAVEFNFAGLAAGADDRYFYHAGQERAGQLQTRQDLANAERIGLVDEWRGLDVSLALSRRGCIRAFPIQTVSQSEGGFELVHQSTVVMPQWSVEADEHGRWEVRLNLRMDAARALSRRRLAA
ncbi:MAG TPA: alpha-amylase/4-alpha-glucanotransferase domain-containing protein [Gemmataceae bacterium]|nr:alpha-amylase/4-alpha-glucanotransferase domain-containing protein [Gemmataceae bacterium]